MVERHALLPELRFGCGGYRPLRKNLSPCRPHGTSFCLSIRMGKTEHAMIDQFGFARGISVIVDRSAMRFGASFQKVVSLGRSAGRNWLKARCARRCRHDAEVTCCPAPPTVVHHTGERGADAPNRPTPLGPGGRPIRSAWRSCWRDPARAGAAGRDVGVRFPEKAAPAFCTAKPMRAPSGAQNAQKNSLALLEEGIEGVASAATRRGSHGFGLSMRFGIEPCRQRHSFAGNRHGIRRGVFERAQRFR